MSDDLVERVARAIFDASPYREHDGPFEQQSERYQALTMRYARAAIAVVLEEAAKIVTEHYQELCTEHRLLLVNRAAAIRALVKHD